MARMPWLLPAAATLAVVMAAVAAPPPEGRCAAEEEEAEDAESDGLGLLQHAGRGGAAQRKPEEPERMLSGDADAGEGRSSFDLSLLGPLAGLLGRWEGKKGISVTQVPRVPPHADGVSRSADFETLIHNYSETITFTAMEGTQLNRGYEDANHFNPSTMLNQTLFGLSYHAELHELTSSGGQGGLIHVEDGQFLFQAEPGVRDDWSICRMALIPHGVTLIALGGWSNRTSPEEVRQAQLQQQVQMRPQNIQDVPTPGGLTYALLPDYTDPIARLQEDIGSVASAEELRGSTAAGSGGSIAQLPNIRAQVFNHDFNSTFWIEYLEDGSQQLQYVQTVFMDFEAKFDHPECASRRAAHTTSATGRGCLIQWPHFQANTLAKVE